MYTKNEHVQGQYCQQRYSILSNNAEQCYWQHWTMLFLTVLNRLFIFLSVRKKWQKTRNSATTCLTAKLRPITKRKHSRRLFLRFNVTFGRLKWKPFRCKTRRFCDCNYHVRSCFDAGFINFYYKACKFRRVESLFRISNDTKAIKLINNCFLTLFR